MKGLGPSAAADAVLGSRLWPGAGRESCFVADMAWSCWVTGFASVSPFSFSRVGVGSEGVIGGGGFDFVPSGWGAFSDVGVFIGILVVTGVRGDESPSRSSFPDTASLNS